MLSERTQVWCCGGGVQSAAIAVLVVEKRLPAPEIAVMVDTGREKSSTWRYVDDVLRPELARAGVELQIVRKADFTDIDLWSRNGKHILVGGFTNKTGHVGKLTNFCSGEWKRDVIGRYLRSVGVECCDNWLGISAEEVGRVRISRRSWCRNRYPLLFDLTPPLRRGDCIRIVEEAGWPRAPRSSCWMCPGMSSDEWLELKDNWPGDFGAAVKLEAEVRLKDANFFLHQSCRPLDQVDFSSQGVLFANVACASGYCSS